MNLKLAVISDDKFFTGQIRQELQSLSQYLDISEQVFDNTGLIVTDEVKYFLEPENNGLCPVFLFAHEFPEGGKLSPKRRFYKMGGAAHKQLARDIAAWISIFDILFDMQEEGEEIARELKQTEKKLEHWKNAALDAYKWQQMLNRPVAGKEFDIAYMFEPASQISGDFLVTKDYKDVAYFALADIVDHGLAASLIGCCVKGIMDTYFDFYQANADIKELVKYLQDTFDKDDSGVKNGVHIIIFEVKKRENKLVMCNIASGGTPPIVITGQGNITIYEDADTVIPPIGDYHAEPILITIPFEPGDGFILVSDGCTETFIGEDESMQNLSYIYGMERLVEAVRPPISANPNWHPDDIVSYVQADLKRYAISEFGMNHQVECEDDTTMLVVRWNPIKDFTEKEDDE